MPPWLRLRLIHRESPAVKVRVVQPFDRGFSAARHFDKTETAEFPGVAVIDQRDLAHLAELPKVLLEFRFIRAVG